MILRAEDQGQLQLVEREEIEDEEDLFEVIDKRKPSLLFNFRSHISIRDFSHFDFLLIYAHTHGFKLDRSLFLISVILLNVCVENFKNL